MGGLKDYRQVVRSAICGLKDYQFALQSDEVDSVFLCDMESGQFQLMSLGWQGKKRISSITLLVRIKNGKIWIEEDWTEDGLATRLMELGVPREDIVLAFHPPHLRPLTDFAVA